LPQEEARCGKSRIGENLTVGEGVPEQKKKRFFVQKKRKKSFTLSHEKRAKFLEHIPKKGRFRGPKKCSGGKALKQLRKRGKVLKKVSKKSRSSSKKLGVFRGGIRP